VWDGEDGVWFSGQFPRCLRQFRGDPQWDSEISRMEKSYSQRATENHRGPQSLAEETAIAKMVIGAAIDVHKALGPGLLESAYRECLHFDLVSMGLKVEAEKPMPIIYKSVKLDHGYRMDLLVENKLVIETKTIEAIAPVHIAQMLTYLRLGDFRLGLIINFHVAKLIEGIKRLAN
jgi:GxxExxY protein